MAIKDILWGLWIPTSFSQPTQPTQQPTEKPKIGVSWFLGSVRSGVQGLQSGFSSLANSFKTPWFDEEVSNLQSWSENQLLWLARWRQEDLSPMKPEYKQEYQLSQVSKPLGISNQDVTTTAQTIRQKIQEAGGKNMDNVTDDELVWLVFGNEISQANQQTKQPTQQTWVNWNIFQTASQATTPEDKWILWNVRVPEIWHFDYNPDDSGTVSTLKRFWNLLSSAGNIAWWITNMAIHPIDTLSWLWKVGQWIADNIQWKDTPEAQATSAVWEELKKPYTSWDEFLKTLHDDPLRIAWDIATLVSWGAWIVAKWWTIAKISEVANTAKTVQKISEFVNPYSRIAWPIINTAMKWYGNAWKRAYDTITNPKTAITTAKWRIENIKKAPWDVVTYWASKIAGLNPETAITIREWNGTLDKLTKWTETQRTIGDDIAQQLLKEKERVSQTWPLYNMVKNKDITVDVSKSVGNIEKEFNKQRIKVNKDWTLDFSESNMALSPTDQKAVQTAWDHIREKPNLDAEAFINKRQALDDTVSYDKQTTSKGESLVKTMRKILDEDGWNQIPWLKKLDSIYWPQQQSLHDLLKDYFWNNGAMKENFYNTVWNLLNKWKELKYDRITKVIPDVEERIKGLKAYEDIQKAMWNKVWAYTQAWVSATWGAIWLQYWWVAGGVLWFLAWLYISNPTRFIQLLKKFPIKGSDELINKIKARAELTAQDQKILKNIANEIQLKGETAKLNKPALPFRPQSSTTIPEWWLPQIKTPQTPLPTSRNIVEVPWNVKQPWTTAPTPPAKPTIKTPMVYKPNTTLMNPKKVLKWETKIWKPPEWKIPEKKIKTPKPFNEVEQHKLSKELEPLVQEAKKYKSADEFFNARNKDRSLITPEKRPIIHADDIEWMADDIKPFKTIWDTSFHKTENWIVVKYKWKEAGFVEPLNDKSIDLNIAKEYQNKWLWTQLIKEFLNKYPEWIYKSEWFTQAGKNTFINAVKGYFTK